MAGIQAGFELILLRFTFLDYQGYRRSWKNELSVPGISQVLGALSNVLVTGVKECLQSSEKFLGTPRILLSSLQLLAL